MKNYFIFIVIYLIVINVFAMIITIVDKLRAIHHGWRVKESALLAISAFGGHQERRRAVYRRVGLHG